MKCSDTGRIKLIKIQLCKPRSKHLFTYLFRVSQQIGRKGLIPSWIAGLPLSRGSFNRDLSTPQNVNAIANRKKRPNMPEKSIVKGGQILWSKILRINFSTFQKYLVD